MRDGDAHPVVRNDVAFKMNLLHTEVDAVSCAVLHFLGWKTHEIW